MKGRCYGLFFRRLDVQMVLLCYESESKRRVALDDAGSNV